MEGGNTLFIDGRAVALEGERNLLEVARKAGIEIPTFCYHSHLSVYGACRLCLVEIEGRGIVTSCSTPPEPGMRVKTSTPEIRSMRKIAVELLLANHDASCTTCAKSESCKLQSLAHRLGVDSVRFRKVAAHRPIDRTSGALVRDPNKCILCGDCVRMCREVQGVGAIDFAHRGPNVEVVPAFNLGLGEVDCVNCGQCAAVCPTGALTAKSSVDNVLDALDDPGKVVVAQIAPAVRVALGECFGLSAGTLTMGHAVAALKRLGFDRVFDTAFAADLTVIEEATEFLARKAAGENLPQFTSCCPAWVTYVERHRPEFLPNLSSCRSPQQMFGSVAKTVLPKELGIERNRLVVVSIMPCTAKKVEAALDKFTLNGNPDVDFVLTTAELGAMIRRAGIRFADLVPESLDMPMGFKTGAGVIFGKSGGVTEAVLRFAGEKLTGYRQGTVEFEELQGVDGVRQASIKLGDTTLKLAVASGLGNARMLLDRIKSGEVDVDLVEVMACPGGCVGGAGQPVAGADDAVECRARGLRDADRTLQLHRSQENHLVAGLYQDELKDAHRVHEMLHTTYAHRRRVNGNAISLNDATAAEPVELQVCVGTNCHLRGSQDLLRRIINHVQENGLGADVDVQATFCFEHCDRGPTVRIGDEVLERCTFERAVAKLDEKLAAAGHSGHPTRCDAERGGCGDRDGCTDRDGCAACGQGCNA